TEQIHVGSGIFNPLPQVNHPAKVAERVAVLDQLTGGRFEFGTGRGAGSHEILGFLPEMTDLSGTREIWGDVIGEFSKMWLNEQIHVGSGIFNPLPQVNHPAKVAERVAMLDHLTGGRFEFGTGRGAGSHEILGFLPGMTDLSGTREIWEDVIGEFSKMWLNDEYPGYEGKYWSLPPRKVLPKPWGGMHPAM